MKKYFKLFMLMLLVFSYSYAGVMPETEWAKRGLKGKVKSMVKTEYGYENSGKIKFTSLVKTEFNEKGKHIPDIAIKLHHTVLVGEIYPLVIIGCYLPSPYQENPESFGDAYDAAGHPGANGIPDIVDEIKWGLDSR